MKKFLKKILLFILIATLVFSVIVMIERLTPPQFSQAYTGAVVLKYNRLMSVNEPKVILVGGSNVAFGFDSKMIEAELEMPVVNLGLHAGLGSKFDMELAKKNINSGDIVLLAIEYGGYSDTIDSDLAWHTIENHYDLYSCIDSKHYINMLLAYPQYAMDKISNLSKAKAMQSNTVYSYAAFNSLGDVEYKRPKNIMKDGYLKSSLVSISDASISDDMIRYLNSYYDYVKSKGAIIYLSFPPVCELAITNDSDYTLFINKLRRCVHIPIISNIKDYILPSDLFYDTNYHLNNTGVQIRTNMVIQDLKSALSGQLK